MELNFSTGESNFLEIPDGCMLSSFCSTFEKPQEKYYNFKKSLCRPAFSAHTNIVI